MGKIFRDAGYWEKRIHNFKQEIWNTLYNDMQLKAYGIFRPKSIFLKWDMGYPDVVIGT